MNMFPDGAERNKALAYFSAVGGIGATAALLIGGPITEALGWEWIFYLNVPVALGLLGFAPILLRESRERAQVRAYDPVGALTITGGLMLLIGAVVQASSHGWGGGAVIGMLLGAAVLIALFIVAESRSAAPLMPLRIFRSRQFVGGNLGMLLFAVTALGMSTTVSAYAQQVLDYSPMEFGLGMVVMTLMTMVGAYGGQAGVTKTGFGTAAVAFALMGVGAFLLTQVSPDGGYFTELFPGLLVFGLGLGRPGGGDLGGDVVDRTEMAGVASGANNAAFQIGGGLGTAVVSGVVVSRADGSTAPAVLTDAFQAGFTTDVIFALAKHLRRAGAAAAVDPPHPGGGRGRARRRTAETEVTFSAAPGNVLPGAAECNFPALFFRRAEYAPRVLSSGARNAKLALFGTNGKGPFRKPSASTSRRPTSTISSGGSTPSAGPPIRPAANGTAAPRPVTSGNWSATGATSTTGVRPKRG